MEEQERMRLLRAFQEFRRDDNESEYDEDIPIEEQEASDYSNRDVLEEKLRRGNGLDDLNEVEIHLLGISKPLDRTEGSK